MGGAVGAAVIVKFPRESVKLCVRNRKKAKNTSYSKAAVSDFPMAPSGSTTVNPLPPPLITFLGYMGLVQRSTFNYNIRHHFHIMMNIIFGKNECCNF